MSEMEYNKGKLTPFDLTEDVAKILVEDKVEKLEYGTYLEQVSADPNWYDRYLCNVNGTWYKAEFESDGGEIYGFAKVKKVESGVIEFETYHYNSRHWTEVLENALNS